MNREQAIAIARAHYARTGVGQYSMGSFVAPEWVISAMMEASELPRENVPAVRALGVEDLAHLKDAITQLSDGIGATRADIVGVARLIDAGHKRDATPLALRGEIEQLAAYLKTQFSDTSERSERQALGINNTIFLITTKLGELLTATAVLSESMLTLASTVSDKFDMLSSTVGGCCEDIVEALRGIRDAR